MDSLVLITTGLVALGSFIAIYLIAKSISYRKKQIQEAKEAVEEELGEKVPDELIRQIIEKKVEETAEKELRKLEQKQRLREVKKANKGLLKLRKRLWIVFMRKGGLPPEIYKLGKAHSYDRYSFDGREDRIVIYYYPVHNSVILNGLQAIISIFGRGRKRIIVPVGTIISGEKDTIIYADYIKSIAPNTFEVVPPEEIKVEIDLYNAYRDRYETLKDILEQTLEDLRMPFKKALVFRGGGGYYMGEYRPLEERGSFIPVEAGEEEALELIDHVWERLKQRKRSLRGE